MEKGQLYEKLMKDIEKQALDRKLDAIRQENAKAKTAQKAEEKKNKVQTAKYLQKHNTREKPANQTKKYDMPETAVYHRNQEPFKPSLAFKAPFDYSRDRKDIPSNRLPAKTGQKPVNYHNNFLSSQKIGGDLGIYPAVDFDQKEHENNVPGWRKANFKDLTLNSISRGYLQSELNRQYFNLLLSPTDEKSKAEIARLEQELQQEEYRFNTGGWGSKALSGTGEFLGQMGYQSTRPEVWGGALAGGKMAATVGAAIPFYEEGITMPAAAVAGFGIGSAKINLEMASGAAYQEMISAGVSHEKAAQIAMAVGAGSAVLETLQIGELSKAYQLLKGRGLDNAFTAKLRQFLENKALKQAGKTALSVAQETGQELAQEGIAIGGSNLGKYLEDKPLDSAGEIKDRLLSTAGQSALTFGLLNVPAMGKNIRQGKVKNLPGDAASELRPEIFAQKEEMAKGETGFSLDSNNLTKAQFSIVGDGKNRFVKIDTDQDIFDGQKVADYPKIARDIMLDKFRGKVLAVSDYDLAKVKTRSIGEYAYPKNTPEKNIESAKMKAAPELDNLLKVSAYSHSAEDDGRHSFASDSWDYYKTVFEVDGERFSGLINIGRSAKGSMFYDITNIKRLPGLSQKQDALLSSSTSASRQSSIDIKIPQKGNDVNNSIWQNDLKDASLLQKVSYEKESLINFARDVMKNPKQNTKLSLGKVTERVIGDIGKLLNIDVRGFEHIITNRTINHINKRHGSKGSADHSMEDINDIGLIEEVLRDYDNISYDGVSASREYRNKDNTLAPNIVYDKWFANGTHYVVEAVPDTKAQKLQVVSAYIDKNRVNKKGAKSAPDEQTPGSTSETYHSLTPSIDIKIPQKSNDVNNSIWQNDPQDTSLSPEEKKIAIREGIRQSGQQYGVELSEQRRVWNIARVLDVAVEFTDQLPKNINGMYKDGIIYIAHGNKRSGIEVFKHELTHRIEGSAHYDKFQKLILQSSLFHEHLGQNGFEDLASYRQALGDYYAQNGSKLDQAAIDKEIVADFVGSELFDNIFTDQDTVRELCLADHSWGQRIKDYLHHLAIKFKGTAEEKFLANAERLYAKALAEVNRVQGEKAKTTQYSIVSQDDGNKYIKIDTDQDIFDGMPTKDYHKIAQLYIKDYLLGNHNLSNQSDVIIDNKTANKYTHPGKRQSYFPEKMRLTPELSNILKIAEKVDQSSAVKPGSKYPFYEYYQAVFSINDKNFKCLLNIGVDSDGNRHLYDINKIHLTGGILQTNANGQLGKMYSTNKIPQSDNPVNNSISANKGNDTVSYDLY